MTKFWECEDCGLTHGHSRHYHSLWNKLDWHKCKKLEYNPECNCGALEAQIRGLWDHPAPVIAVPREVEQEIREKYE